MYYSTMSLFNFLSFIITVLYEKQALILLTAHSHLLDLFKSCSLWFSSLYVHYTAALVILSFFFFSQPKYFLLHTEFIPFTILTHERGKQTPRNFTLSLHNFLTSNTSTTLSMQLFGDISDLVNVSLFTFEPSLFISNNRFYDLPDTSVSLVFVSLYLPRTLNKVQSSLMNCWIRQSIM